MIKPPRHSTVNNVLGRDSKEREPWRRFGVDRSPAAWGGSFAGYRDDEFDMVDDDSLGLVDIDDPCDRDED